MGQVTSAIYVQAEGWQQVEGANADEDFKFVKMVYHNSSNPGQFVALENEHWAPFIKSAMDSKKVMQKAWGNARVLSPTGPNIGVNSISYDVYSSLKEALNPTWSEDLQVPMEGMEKLNEITLNQRGGQVYRIVKVVSK